MPYRVKTSILLTEKNRDFAELMAERLGISLGEVCNHAIEQMIELIEAEKPSFSPWTKLYKAKLKEKGHPEE